jgi:hypothetical protein
MMFMKKVAAMWRLPGSKRLFRIMKNGFTPEEAEVCSGYPLTRPADNDKKLSKDEKWGPG